MDNRYSHANGGTGLGLALVRELAELHGGEFSIYSKVNVGTSATVRLPQPPTKEKELPNVTCHNAA